MKIITIMALTVPFITLPLAAAQKIQGPLQRDDMLFAASARKLTQVWDTKENKEKPKGPELKKSVFDSKEQKEHKENGFDTKKNGTVKHRQVLECPCSPLQTVEYLRFANPQKKEDILARIDRLRRMKQQIEINKQGDMNNAALLD